MAVPDINNIAISDASVSTVIGGTISFVQWFSLPPQSENNSVSVGYPSSVRDVYPPERNVRIATRTVPAVVRLLLSRDLLDGMYMLCEVLWCGCAA